MIDSRLLLEQFESTVRGLGRKGVDRASLDGRNHLTLEIGVDPRKTKVDVSQRAISLRTRPGSPLKFSIRVSTDAAPLSATLIRCRALPAMSHCR